MFCNSVLILLLVHLFFLSMLQLRLALQNKKLTFGQGGHAKAVKLFEERLEVLQTAQRQKQFKAEEKQLMDLQRRSKLRREMDAMAATVTEAQPAGLEDFDE